MATLRDLLKEETEDNLKAAQYAAHGRSITGMSNRHTETPTDRMYGERAEPIVGERIVRMSSYAQPPADIEALIKGDPVFNQRRIEPLNREPFGSLDQILAWKGRDGYRHYWFSDLPGRVHRARRAGYEHVQDPDTGEPMMRVTDKSEGRGRGSYLMEIPYEWYQADMTRQAEQLAERLDDIRYGRAGPGSDDNRYIPRQGISITGR